MMELLVTERLEEFFKVVAGTKVVENMGMELSLQEGINKTFEIIDNARESNRGLYIIGNGGSAAIASHAAIDFLNMGKISAHTLHDSATFTCMANDYGYEYAFSNIIELTLKSKDILIAISSSGHSKNIINAVESAKQLGSIVITLSGFDSKNNLRKKGDINFWCNSRDYGMVEIAHQFILHNLSDKFIGSDN